MEKHLLPPYDIDSKTKRIMKIFKTLSALAVIGTLTFISTGCHKHGTCPAYGNQYKVKKNKIRASVEWTQDFSTAQHTKNNDPA